MMDMSTIYILLHLPVRLKKTKCCFVETPQLSEILNDSVTNKLIHNIGNIMFLPRVLKAYICRQIFYY